jgi:hypothetical protein
MKVLDVIYHTIKTMHYERKDPSIIIMDPDTYQKLLVEMESHLQYQYMIQEYKIFGIDFIITSTPTITGVEVR